ncbi:ketoacyl-ACP synthase III [Bacteroidales bacterium OttesenSCG-928-M06]|nr:ketoacyl-ACP synthase III [Bacteroidales bacterium OttesenSCG-928-M06]
MNAYIKGISYYLPEKVVTNEELVNEFPEWTVEKVANKIGVHERHIVQGNETALDLARKACLSFFKEYEIEKSTIDFILFCTQSPDYYLPTTACILQEQLGLSTKCGALDFNLGCSGYIYGLSLAKGLITAGIAKNILLVTSETYSKHIHPKDKGNRTIFGDAAAVTLVSTEGIAEILNFSLGTDGKGAENLIVKTGALKNPERKNRVDFNDSGNPISDDYLYMNGSEIFNFTLDAVPPLVDDVLKKNHTIKEDVDLFVFHQANKHMLNFLRRKIKIEEDKFYYYMENVGNTVSSTIPIALKEALLDNSIKKDAQVLIAGFGVGYSWGATILKF